MHRTKVKVDQIHKKNSEVVTLPTSPAARRQWNEVILRDNGIHKWVSNPGGAVTKPSNTERFTTHLPDINNRRTALVLQSIYKHLQELETAEQRRQYLDEILGLMYDKEALRHITKPDDLVLEEVTLFLCNDLFSYTPTHSGVEVYKDINFSMKSYLRCMLHRARSLPLYAPALHRQEHDPYKWNNESLTNIPDVSTMSKNNLFQQLQDEDKQEDPYMKNQVQEMYHHLNESTLSDIDTDAIIYKLQKDHQSGINTLLFEACNMWLSGDVSNFHWKPRTFLRCLLLSIREVSMRPKYGYIFQHKDMFPLSTMPYHAHKDVISLDRYFSIMAQRLAGYKPGTELGYAPIPELNDSIKGSYVKGPMVFSRPAPAVIDKKAPTATTTGRSSRRSQRSKKPTAPSFWDAWQDHTKNHIPATAPTTFQTTRTGQTPLLFTPPDTKPSPSQLQKPLPNTPYAIYWNQHIHLHQKQMLDLPWLATTA